MHIDLNGLPYILNMRWHDDGQGLVAELVDEAFCEDIVRAGISDISTVVHLIERTTSVTPDEETILQISRQLTELLQDLDLRQGNAGSPMAHAAGM